jgi:hypothetical protein
MVKRFIYIAVVTAFTLMLSCTGGEDHVSIPEGIIPPDSLVGVIVDSYLVEAALNDIKDDNKDVDKFVVPYYKSVFKKHGITPGKFNKSMEFYSYHPKLLRSVYDQVLSELSKMQSESLR